MSKSSATSEFYYACRNGLIDKVRDQLPTMTLEEIDEIQANGSTALHAATYFGHKEIVQLLLERGASRSIKNEHNCFPYDEAEKPEIKELFLRRSSSRFTGDDIGHVDWIKSDSNAVQLAQTYRYRHSGFGWQNKNIDHRLKHIQDEMSGTNDERIRSFISQAQKDPFFILRAYTYESEFYKKLNKDLAAKHYDHGTNFGITYFIDFFYNNPAFNHLSFKGKLYRGMCITSDDLEKYKEGAKIMNKAFMSMTKDRSVAENFATKDFKARQKEHGGEAKLSVLCIYEIVNQRTGLDIEAISEYSHEKEVLVGPYSAFTIKSIKRKTSTSFEIHLQECEAINDENNNDNGDDDDDDDDDDDEE